MEVDTRKINSWIVRQRLPDSPSPHQTILLLHGWTGDENAMWIFARRLPKDAFLISPRGIFPTQLGGYGWHNHQAGKWPTVEDLKPAVLALNDLLVPENFENANLDHFHIVGFSQGAALGFAFSFLFPEKVLSVAGLSGFLPGQAGEFIHKKSLNDLPVFIAHGTKDDRVPVERARQAIHHLQEAGADVVYCEDDVGHKLSLTCFSSLEDFSALHFKD